jgi:hypothetical protein
VIGFPSARTVSFGRAKYFGWLHVTPKLCAPGSAAPAAQEIDRAKDGVRDRVWLYAFLALSFLAVVSLLLVQVPPLGDYANHLARILVLSKIHSDPFYSRYFELSLRPVPDLAFDAFMLPVSQIVSPYTAGRLFLGLSLVMTIAGVSMLHQALFGRRSLWPLVAQFLCTTRSFCRRIPIAARGGRQMVDQAGAVNCPRLFV